MLTDITSECFLHYRPLVNFSPSTTILEILQLLLKHFSMTCQKLTCYLSLFVCFFTSSLPVLRLQQNVTFMHRWAHSPFLIKHEEERYDKELWLLLSLPPIDYRSL